MLIGQQGKDTVGRLVLFNLAGVHRPRQLVASGRFADVLSVLARPSGRRLLEGLFYDLLNGNMQPACGVPLAEDLVDRRFDFVPPTKTGSGRLQTTLQPGQLLAYAIQDSSP